MATNLEKTESSYYYAVDGKQLGPFNKLDLLSKIKADTLVWREGMDEWTNAFKVEELKDYFPEKKTQKNSLEKSLIKTVNEDLNQFENTTKNKNNYNLIIGILIATILIMGSLFLIKENDNNEEKGENIEKKDSISIPEINDTNGPEIAKESPVSVIRNFLSALNDGEFRKAYKMQNVKRLGTEDHFCSKKGYGGTSKVEILDVDLDYQNRFEAQVIAKYITYDPYNSNWEIERKFSLELINGKWIISDLKNISANKF